MRINADLDRAALVDTTALDWSPSPSHGVERRMIERAGDELARATSLVRYAPGSRFDAHTHGGGEEFLVLAGTFCDEEGRFPAGTYVRNLVGTAHAPHTDEGCTIFVKLWWMHPDDQQSARVDTTDPEAWEPGPWPGTYYLCLHRYAGEETGMLALEPSAGIPARDVDGGEELLVVSGEARMNGETLAEGTWHRHPGSGVPALDAPAGCVVLRKRGHLAHPPPLPHGA